MKCVISVCHWSVKQISPAPKLTWLVKSEGLSNQRSESVLMLEVKQDILMCIKQLCLCWIHNVKSGTVNESCASDSWRDVSFKSQTWRWRHQWCCKTHQQQAGERFPSCESVASVPLPALSLSLYVVTHSASSSSMTDCYLLKRKRIWLLTSGPLQLQTRALYINQKVLSKQRDHPPINLSGNGGITCSCNPG